MIKNTKEQFPGHLPLYYRIFCRVRKIRRQTCVRVNEYKARKNGPLDVIPDGVFVKFNGGVKVNPGEVINKSAYRIDDDLSLPRIKNVADKIESVKGLLRLNNLRYTSSAGMFIRRTYTQESQKGKLWENSWIAVHSGV